jgi:hypothetical protein
MKPHTLTARRVASTAALIAAAGLAMAGCKSSTTSSSTGNSSNSGSSASASSSSSASTGGSSSGGGGTTSSSDGVGYFPIGVGNTWVYETHLTSASTGTITNKMTKVEPDGSAQRVTMQVSTDLGGTTNKPITVTYLFNSDGSITVPIGQLAGGIVKIKSGSIAWPSEADLNSGQPHSSTLVFDATIAGRTTHVTAHVTVQGGGSQTVTVPAGTYNAHVINEIFREKIEGISVSLRLKTWVANGVGPVKSDLITKSGAASVPGTVEVLKSFTKG